MQNWDKYRRQENKKSHCWQENTGTVDPTSILIWKLMQPQTLLSYDIISHLFKMYGTKGGHLTVFDIVL